MKTNCKSVLGTIWKVGLGLCGVATVAVAVLFGIIWYELEHGRDVNNDYMLTTAVRVEAYNDGCVRVMNLRKTSYTTQKIRWVSGVPDRDSLTVFCDMGGKRGFLNVNDGEIVIPAQYNKAWQFSEGLGAVLGNNGKIGFIDKEGLTVIDFVIPYEKGFDYIFKDGFCVARFWEGNNWRFGVYQKDGSMALAWCYNRIDEPNEQGYRVVANEDGAWLFDRYFNSVLPDRYDNLNLAEGNTGVYATKNHVKQLLDFDGRVVEPFVMDRIYPLKYMVKYLEDTADEYEMAQDVLAYQVDNWDGLMDARTGKILTPAIYWNLEMVSSDLIKANLGYSDECVILDLRGRVVKQ